MEGSNTFETPVCTDCQPNGGKENAKLITHVLVDTSALQRKDFDFAGITKSSLPLFFSLLKTNGIRLLNHRVLDTEIRSHIRDAKSVVRFENLKKAIKECAKQLTLIPYLPANLSDIIDQYSFAEILLSAYSTAFSDALLLPYPDPHSVFLDYFRASPPFAPTGKKKEEFPDAFILKSLTNFVTDNDDVCILVVSGDDDWKETVANVPQITFADSIESAFSILWGQFGDISEIVNLVLDQKREDLQDSISSAAKCDSFSLLGIDDADEVEVNDVTVCEVSRDFVVLESTETKARIALTVHASIDGFSEFFDADRSAWDDEGKNYIFMAYSLITFTNGAAELECEVQLSFDENYDAMSVSIDEVKITSDSPIPIDLSGADAQRHDLPDFGFDDYLGEIADAQEQYYLH